MSENIANAWKAAQQMFFDCQQQINQLNELKEVYNHLANSGDYGYDPDIPESKSNIHFIEEIDSYPLPLRGIFDFARQYPTISSINLAIETYKNMGNVWVKIRDQLDHR